MAHRLDLQTPLGDSRLPTLTASISRRLAEQLDLRTVRDLLWHLPLRYEHRESIFSIASVREGAAVSVIGTVQRLRAGRTMRKHLAFAEVFVSDPTGTLQAIWFNQPWMASRFKVGDRLLLTGIVRASSGRRYLGNPQWELLERVHSQETTNASAQTGVFASDDDATMRILPIYPETEGITSRWLNYLVRETLKRLLDIPDPLPEPIRIHHELAPLTATLFRAHLPQTILQGERAREELLFRELFVLQCAVQLARAQREQHKAISIPFNGETVKKLIATLPFRLTEAQRMATYEILRDIEHARPMRRILVGDVGSGKTIVAAIAMLAAIREGKGQTAIMAPTEILATQHFDTLSRLLKPFRIRVALLTGTESLVTPKRVVSQRALPISKPRLFKEISEGSIHVLVGTHALISKPRARARSRLKPQGPLRFARLLLAIIDEQHRFGVAQRKRMGETEQIFATQAREPLLDVTRRTQNSSRLSASRSTVSQPRLVVSRIEPHLLTLTATPIPRTLALTMFGDLDVSRITELPSERKPIATTLLKEHDERIAFMKVRDEVRAGRQAFVICPLVSPSEKIETKAAVAEFVRLTHDVFPDLRLGLLHGQMKSKEKFTIMQRFQRGAISVLVSTPVVEVGIDIPNATVMVILGAERFGLAQLYQFRGRVGRGEHPSSCFLISSHMTPLVRKRLHAVANAKSGTDIAEVDLKLRGPGELLGIQQSGVPDTLMQALGNIELIERARRAAREALQTRPLRNFPALQHAVAETYAQLHIS